MSQTILIKRSAVSGKIPTTAQLSLGELAVNTNDGKVYLKKNSAGIDSIVEIGATSLSGDVTGSGNGSISVSLAATGVTAGTYTKITVDAKGRATSGGSLLSSDIPALDWSKISSGKPTTRDGYGITDVPKTDGTGASGTWGINITGQAATCNNFRSFGVIVINPVASLNSTCTTAQFISHLTALGMFNYGYSVAKVTWDYAGNNDISDTGFGTVEMAGCVIETFTDGTAKHVRITRPTTGSGNFQILVYNDQGSGYSPGWRSIGTNENACMVNPITPKDGDIKVVSGVISIYASSAWRQVYPILYA